MNATTEALKMELPSAPMTRAEWKAMQEANRLQAERIKQENERLAALAESFRAQDEAEAKRIEEEDLPILKETVASLLAKLDAKKLANQKQEADLKAANATTLEEEYRKPYLNALKAQQEADATIRDLRGEKVQQRRTSSGESMPSRIKAFLIQRGNQWTDGTTIREAMGCEVSGCLSTNRGTLFQKQMGEDGKPVKGGSSNKAEFWKLVPEAYV